MKPTFEWNTVHHIGRSARVFYFGLAWRRSLRYWLLLGPLFAAGPLHASDGCTNAIRHSCCPAAEANVSTQYTDKSLYQLEATWTNDNGQPLRLGALKGGPQIVTMFFANCQYACPLLVEKMKQIEATLPENIHTNVGFTLVSFDSEHDTPAALHSYRVQHGLEDNWTLLHGNPDDVLDLAALLGVKFKKDAQGQFIHSNVITVLNSNGEIAFQQTGLDLSPDEIVQHVKTLIAT